MILITGGSGFLGRYLVDEFLARKHTVRLLVRNPKSVESLIQPGLEVVQGDLLDPFSLETALEGVDYVVHSAALVSFWKRRRRELLLVNGKGTENLVDRCLEHPIQKFVYISSVAALGRTQTNAAIDESAKWRPSKMNTYYGKTKYIGEKAVVRAVQEGLPAVICNPGLIVGKGDWTKGTPKMFHSIYNGLKFRTPGKTGFIAAVDVARAAAELCMSDYKGGERFITISDNWWYKDYFAMLASELGVKGPRYNVPGWMARFAGRMLELIARITKKEPVITLETTRISRYPFEYDGSKLSRELGFQYSDLKAVVRETAQQYLKEHGNPG